MAYQPLAAAQETGDQHGQYFAGRLLAAHNSERSAVGMKTLRWNAVLAQEADVWAQALAQRGAFEHSQSRGGAGENLWAGTSGWFSLEDMVGAFLEEREHFRPGRFPEVSQTGNWAHVGHYTQIIWPETREVGCALASGKGRDVLVCRYWPAGNIVGRRVP